ncbi:MAG: hypothetical protein PHI01_05340, partial [Candidatus Izemoplasmatales bacterium]|nr:hypothetical protein [Candidatus Izemoplasmatales bacterium]
MALLILVPSLILLLLAFSTLSIYDPGSFTFTLEHFRIFSQSYLTKALGNSLWLSLITTGVCFLIGYPVAYFLARLKEKTRKIWLALLIFPLWANMLLRIFAGEKIFTP